MLDRLSAVPHGCDRDVTKVWRVVARGRERDGTAAPARTWCSAHASALYGRGTTRRRRVCLWPRSRVGCNCARMPEQLRPRVSSRHTTLMRAVEPAVTRWGCDSWAMVCRVCMDGQHYELLSHSLRPQHCVCEINYVVRGGSLTKAQRAGQVKRISAC